MSGLTLVCNRCGAEFQQRDRRGPVPRFCSRVCQRYNSRTASGWHKGWRDRLRAAVITAYGSKCACCGEATCAFLTIDHIYNDGAAHRKATNFGAGTQLYGWLKKHGFPKDRFQLLCMNCNFAKGHYGHCPHKLV